MSVGFSAGSLGDILATTELIVQIAQVVYSNRSVSEDCETLAIELQSLHGTLLVLNGALERCRSTPLGEPLIRFIQPEIVQCHRSLAKFSKQLDTFRLSLSSTSFANLWRKLVWVGSAEAASLSANLSSHRLKLVMLLISLNSVGLMDVTITCLDEVRGRLHKEPHLTGHIKEQIIGIMHPLGVTIPIPTWACTTWESTHYLISTYSRNRIGQRYIERGDYQVVRPESDTIVDHSKFAKAVKGGETVEICVIARLEKTLKEDERRCPKCQNDNTTAQPDNGWMTCYRCCGRFQVNNNVRIDSEETARRMSASNTLTSCEKDVDHKDPAGKRGDNSRTLSEEKAEPSIEETDAPSTSNDMTDLQHFRRIILAVEVHTFVMAVHVPHYRPFSTGMDIDLDWCLTCNKLTDDSSPYCSSECENRAGPSHISIPPVFYDDEEQSSSNDDNLIVHDVEAVEAPYISRRTGYDGADIQTWVAEVPLGAPVGA